MRWIADPFLVQFVIFFFSQRNTDECNQEGVDVEEVEEAMVADEEEEEVSDEADTVELDERPSDVEADVTPSAAATRPGANIAVVSKAVRRLSFCSGGGGGGNEPKKLKMSSSGKAKEQRKVPNKPISKTKKAGLVFSVSRVHNRLKENRYANRVRFYPV